MEKYRFPKPLQTAYEKLSAPFAVYQYVDRRVVTLALSDGFCELFGYRDRKAAYLEMDRDMYRDTHPDDVARIANAASHFAREGGSYEVIYRSRKAEGGWRVIHATGKHVCPEPGVRLAEISYTDEGDYAEEESPEPGALTRALSCALRDESLIKASYYDPLTGLPGMSYFFELAAAGRESIRSRGGRPAILYLDLSGMKFYNDRYGFTEGDLLLRSFAKILVRFFSNENCCRIGADHFVVYTEEKELESTLQSLFRECRSQGSNCMPPVRVGIYQDCVEEVPVSAACDRAKIACDALKNSYSYSWNYYDQNLRSDVQRRHYILENLDRALTEKWIQVWYQPIVRTANGMVSDEEALSRWLDPEHGMLSPAEFIPVLEDAGVIWKHDLYVLDRVLEKLRRQESAGIIPVPQSINLSRCDFEACDMVEEIRRRVDAAHIRREMITVEITESTIGGNREFMKEQVCRFRQLGFPVWMDDFGTGYSSIDLLQSIRFDLIKFDMSFLSRLDEGDSGKIVLRDLVKMATALDTDTVCEGVETEEQVRFLQEIGCAKLQGYWYNRPSSYEELMAQYEAGDPLRYENPAETAYYEIIGRANLYDLSLISNPAELGLRGVFGTLPVGILEIRDGKVRFVRSTQSLRAFMQRYFGINLSLQAGEFVPAPAGTASRIVGALIRHCGNSHALLDETLPDGSFLHFYARRIASDPVTGAEAVAVAVLKISDAVDGTSYADIARALATDYYNIYYVDLNTENFIEYTSPAGEDELAYERHGKDFFEECRLAAGRIYEEDRSAFFARFTRENIIRRLDEQGVFTLEYRLMDTGSPIDVRMKIVRTQPGGNYIVIGISLVETRLKEQEEAERLLQERLSYGRIARSQRYLLLYCVDPQTETYFRFGDTETAACPEPVHEDSFFGKVVESDLLSVCPEDRETFRRSFTKEHVMSAIQSDGIFGILYRMRLDGETVPVLLRAAYFEEGDGTRLIVGVKRTATL
ncbi:MAG: EAL domain-containing protein [Oscillospiraceae bacterium]|nr:EAL domain-containing protein [Oscillospiraceae bacterium]